VHLRKVTLDFQMLLARLVFLVLPLLTHFNNGALFEAPDCINVLDFIIVLINCSFSNDWTLELYLIYKGGLVHRQFDDTPGIRAVRIKLK
jgi:hypothetical protein